MADDSVADDGSLESDKDPGGGAADDGDASWGVDAALGAASIAARTAGEVAGTIGTSAPGRALEGAARWLSRPLAREGEAVRERLGDEAGPAAQQVIRQVTPGVVDAVDLNEVLAAIDIDALLDRIDVNRIVDRVDVASLVAKVDVADVVAKIDLDALLASIDIDALLDRIDVGALVARIDLDMLLESVDLDALLSRLDLDQLLGSVDLNAVLAAIDMDALMSNTELGAIIAQSTSGVASELLDVVRSQGVGMDNFIARVANRALRRDRAELPAGPPLLVGDRLALPAPSFGDEPTAEPGQQ